MKRIRNLLSNLLLIELAVVLLIIVLSFFYKNLIKNQEGYYNNQDYNHYSKFPYIMFKPRPGLETKYIDHYIEKPVILNELGYRGEAPNKEKDGSYRIFIVGGSSVFGTNIDLASSLELLFHEKNKKI